MIKLLYAGFDSLDVSFQGALPKETLKELAVAQKEAADRQEPQLISFGPGNVEAHILGRGARGGYAFILDTGPVGELWTFKDNSDTRNWNIGVSVRAAALASQGYYTIKKHLFERLEAMGCRVANESIRRVDFATDFLMPASFELKLDQVVAHSHAKVSPYWGEQTVSQTNSDQPSAVIRGRKLESVTVGKMPGRQVIIYNKRKEAIERRKLLWFKIWNIDPKDSFKHVWRVELRAGKKELKNRWRLTTFQDFENAIGDVFTHAADKVRYLDDFQTDGNISRQRLHPLWDAVNDLLDRDLFAFRSGLLPGQVIETTREQQKEVYLQQIQGNAAGLSVALDLSDEETRMYFGEQLAQTLCERINSSDTTFWDSRDKVQKRLHFRV